jgi:hypothetical protein
MVDGGVAPKADVRVPMVKSQIDPHRSFMVASCDGPAGSPR